MTPSRFPLEAKALKQPAQIVERDVGVAGCAQYPLKQFSPFVPPRGLLPDTRILNHFDEPDRPGG